MVFRLTDLEKENAMNTWIKALAAGVLTVLAAGGAAAHGRHHPAYEARPYYPALVRVAPYYAPAPVYYREQYVLVRPEWRARQQEQWRREQWRHEQWRRGHWGHRHDRHGRCPDPYWRR
jgi:spermidine synthase